MKNFLLITLILFGFYSCSCEGITKKAAKKSTEIALDVIEGATEAISERGEKIGENLTDAAGNVAKGSARSIDKLLNEHRGKSFGTYTCSGAGWFGRRNLFRIYR